MISNSLPRLGFYYHSPLVQEDGRFRVPGFLGRFLDRLAEHCEKLTCFFHEPANAASYALCDYTLCSKNINVINLGLARSAPFRSFYPISFLQRFRPYCQKIDALMLRGPSPLLPPLAHAAKVLPVILLLVGDYVEVSEDAPQPYWRKLLIKSWAKWYGHEQLQVAKHCLTFVNSAKLYDQFSPLVRNLYETRTTTLEEADFYERSDTCQQRPIRLLYTGRFSVAKGLFDILDALTLLVKGGEDVVLDLVGWPESGEEDIVERLKIVATKNGVGDRIFEHGYQPVGSRLFMYYRQADIYVLASRSSEGFPRTIWEAMANSLPVIATCVGSIPSFIEDAARLVQPRDSAKLAWALSEVIHQNDFRKKIIAQGMKLARRNTLDTQVGLMADMIRTWLVDKKGGIPVSLRNE
jgi:glycosyltransferase involved in cell wall biosynthesis